MRRKASVLLFSLRLCQHAGSPALTYHILNLETACSGTHVVHSNEVVCFPADVCLCEFASAESEELVLEPIFKVGYVLVDSG